MIEQRVTLRYDAQQIPAIVQAVQGDTGRDVIFELADYEIPAGATANYYIDKPDDTAIYNSAEVISSTEILAHLTEQALAVPGRNNGQVRILADDEVITSFDFVLEVEAFRGILRLQSETEVNIFDQAIEEAVNTATEEAVAEIQAQTPVVTGMQNSIAPTYSTSSTYAVGDYVMYNAQLYRCITAITTAEAWTAAHWIHVPITTEVSDLKSSINQMLMQPVESETITNQSGYYDRNGFHSASGFSCALYECTSGESIIVTASGNSSFGALWWYDSEMQFVSESDRDVKYVDADVIVPTGASYLGLNNLNGTSGSVSSISVKKSSSNNPHYIDELTKMVEYDFRPNHISITSSNYATDLPDFNTAETNIVYNIFGCLNSIANHPATKPSTDYGTFWSIDGNGSEAGANFTVQYFAAQNMIYTRYKLFGSWTAWSKIYTSYDEQIVKGYGERITSDNYQTDLSSFDNAKRNTIYNIFNCMSSIANYPTDASGYESGTLMTFNGNNEENWTVQVYATKKSGKAVLYYRYFIDGSWLSWQKFVSEQNKNANLEILDCFAATSIDRSTITGIDSNTSILAFGDSITQGYSQITKNWLGYVVDKTGCTVVNKAIGGASFGESIAEQAYWISTQIENTTPAEWGNASLVIIAAGTNDAGGNTPHAELRQKVESAITTIKSKTSAPILFITPIRRGSSDADADLLKLPLISGIICNVALENNCSVIKGFDFPIPTYSIGQITDMTIDHLHPDNTGTKVYAQTFLSNIL